MEPVIGQDLIAKLPSQARILELDLKNLNFYPKRKNKQRNSQDKALL